ncbi:hypothetical protein CSPHI_02560 [Corynebacterium sphenisci DSM 44792]|uniref:HpcH/HpaI aldolase/citrate lyase domain-containing protein n=1 Tax=Corynebacterium sphenisci DSM 44792 TaxID=1437874 RepID=A0A1L7CWE1_9CORY|nr:aldolase/citrate lyase family protein [Corynebacterium sphenisci]APT90138.1 hypothetical protein CSPHI_02560 [Corynebacterium sphenisci DSM 44792]
MSAWIPPGPAILFVPADRPDRWARAAERADAVIIDLEDGCRPEHRERARARLRAAAAAGELDPGRTIVRITPADSGEQAADLAALAGGPIELVMLPKAESAGQVAAVARAEGAPPGGYRVIALAETPAGVLAAERIAAAEGAVALFWGAEDLVAGLGGTDSRHADGSYRDIPRHARARVRLAAAAAGVAALDAVHLDIGDAAGLRAEARDAVALGFAATCCIHPDQVDVIRDAYLPTAERADWARRLIAAAAAHPGAFRFEGAMVDAPLIRQAEAIVRRLPRGDRS